MNIKSQKDFFSGLMFMGVGVAFAWGATTYSVGTGARMGPGYFPLMLGVLLTIIGAAITFTSLVVEAEGGDKIGKWAWKPL
ncbi:tripartite tricarboxylate transporter TctB family protein, partial [Polaromonas sp.]|uniref:tripartite tricarboxylate transporter TctB family protein n=1 Tax=Polaromonas sp. TaxID=1869339 RepID=UPI0032656E76